MATDFIDILKKIKCGDLTASVFTKDDLDKVKACLPPVQKPVADEVPGPPSFEKSCMPAALQQADEIIKESLKNAQDVNELAIIRGRLDEISQNLLVVQTYFSERLNYFLRVSRTMNALNAELMYVNAKLSDDRVELSKDEKKELRTRRDALKDNIANQDKLLVQTYPPITNSPVAKDILAATVNDLIGVISGKIVGRLTDNMVFQFTLRLKELTNATYQQGQESKTVKVRKSRFLTNTGIMNDMSPYVSLIDSSVGQDEKDSKSKLYDGRGNYRGLYKTLRAPIQNLYTLEERGLTLNVDEVDPLLSGNPDTPKTFTEDNQQYFIKNLEKFEGFYKQLGSTLPERTKNEREVVYPSKIKEDLDKIKYYARLESANLLRGGEISKNISQDTIYNKKTYKAGSNTLTTTLKIYKDSADDVTKRIADIQVEIANIEQKIKEASADPEQIEKKIMAIDCFKTTPSANPANCEEKAKQKLGTDPFGIRTLKGTDASLPDMTSPCYWKYFAQELTMMGLLPVPDLTFPIFRYYPINCMVPAFPGPVLLTLPQKWKVLTVISSPLGTIVPMLSFPITFPSPMPIPLPSIFVFYLAPDGSKYMLLAPNIPSLLLPNQAKLGFTFDSSAHNPLGLSGPYSGLPIKGAMTMPLTVSAASSKATRLAKITADLAMGKSPSVVMPNGKAFPGDKGEVTLDTLRNKLKSGDEFALDAAQTTPVEDFDRLVTKIRSTINKQIDSFDDFVTESLQKQKDRIRQERSKKLEAAKQNSDPAQKRKLKTKSRSFDPLKLDEKINTLIEEANKLIDNLTLGEIVYPDDPSKLNPHLSSAITSIVDLVEMAARGELKTQRDSDLSKKIRRVIKKIDVNALSKKKQFNLEDKNDFIEFKKVLSGLSNSAVDYLKGKPKPIDTSEARNKKEATKMAEADKEMQDLLVKSLSFTAIAFASPPTVSVFKPGKPCCETPAESLFKGVRPEVLAVLSIFSSLMAALIEKATIDDIKVLLNIKNLKAVGLDSIKDIFDLFIKQLPPIKIPKTFNASALISSIIVPVLSAISLPELPIPGKPLLPIQIRIPLDAIIKPLLKLALAALIQAILRLMADLFNKLTGTGADGRGVNSTIDVIDVIREIDCGAFGIVKLQRIRSNKIQITLPNGRTIKLPIFPDLPLDIFAFFGFMMTTDVISFLKKLINAALDSILTPIESIVRPILSLVPSGSWSSLTPLDLANPIAAIIKYVKLEIEGRIPKGNKITLINMDIYPPLAAAALLVLDNLEKFLKEIAYMGVAVACAIGPSGVQLARLTHPIFNQDDLPPWERLTRKNPLFAIFLDEILHRSTYMSLGSLIFQTKLPGMYGVTTLPIPGFMPPPRP